MYASGLGVCLPLDRWGCQLLVSGCLGRHPWPDIPQPDPAWPDLPLPRYYGMQSTSRRHAYHWNPFLLYQFSIQFFGNFPRVSNHSLACFTAFMEWIPEIHLWCNSSNLLVISMVTDPISHIFFQVAGTLLRHFCFTVKRPYQLGHRDMPKGVITPSVYSTIAIAWSIV